MEGVQAQWRPRTVGGVLDGALRLYLQNFLPLFGVALVQALVIWVVELLQGTARPAVLLSVVYVVSAVTGVVVGPLLFGTAGAAATSPGWTPGSLDWSALRRIWPFLVATVVLSVLAGLGFMLFLIPGIVLLTWWSLVPIVVIVEDRRAMAALGRSRALVRGLFWHVFGAGFFGSVVFSLIFFLLDLVVRLPFLVHDTHLATLWGVLVASATTPWVPCLLAVLYTDLRARKEGTDLVAGMEGVAQ